MQFLKKKTLYQRFFFNKITCPNSKINLLITYEIWGKINQTNCNSSYQDLVLNKTLNPIKIYSFHEESYWLVYKFRYYIKIQNVTMAIQPCRSNLSKFHNQKKVLWRVQLISLLKKVKPSTIRKNTLINHFLTWTSQKNHINYQTNRKKNCGHVHTI